MSKITSEELRKISAQKQDGVFMYEENSNYDGEKTSPHIIRYTPNERHNADGSVSVGLSFPVVCATSWLGNARDVLSMMTRHINAAPDLAAEILDLRERNEQLRSYCSATAHMCTGVADILKGGGFDGLGKAVAECVETSDFMRLASENNEDPAVWQDAVTERNDKILALREEVARQQEMAGKLVDALNRLINPSPGVKKLPPWVYGIVCAALSDWERSND